MQRAHLDGVCGAQCLENTPRNTAKNLTDQEDLDVGCEERDEDEGHHHEESHHVRTLEPEPVRDDTDEGETETLSDRRAIAQPGLPWGGNLVTVRLHLDTVVPAKGRLRLQRPDQFRVVAFHDDRRGQEDRPADGFWIGLYRFPKRELVFLGVCCLRSRKVAPSRIILTLGVGGLFGVLFEDIHLDLSVLLREMRK